MFLDFFSLFKGITQGISQKGKKKPKKPKETVKKPKQGTSPIQSNHSPSLSFISKFFLSE